MPHPNLAILFPGKPNGRVTSHIDHQVAVLVSIAYGVGLSRFLARVAMG